MGTEYVWGADGVSPKDTMEQDQPVSVPRHVTVMVGRDPHRPYPDPSEVVPRLEAVRRLLLLLQWGEESAHEHQLPEVVGVLSGAQVEETEPAPAEAEDADHVLDSPLSGSIFVWDREVESRYPTPPTSDCPLWCPIASSVSRCPGPTTR